MFSYRRATDEKKEIDKDLSIQVYSGTSRHQQAEHALIWRHICIFVILVFFAFPISSVLTRIYIPVCSVRIICNKDDPITTKIKNAKTTGPTVNFSLSFVEEFMSTMPLLWMFALNLAFDFRYFGCRDYRRRTFCNYVLQRYNLSEFVFSQIHNIKPILTRRPVKPGLRSACKCQTSIKTIENHLSLC